MQVQLALPGPLFPAHGKDIHSFTTLGSSAGGPVFCICLRSRQLELAPGKSFYFQIIPGIG